MVLEILKGNENCGMSFCRRIGMKKRRHYLTISRMSNLSGLNQPQYKQYTSIKETSVYYVTIDWPFVRACLEN